MLIFVITVAGCQETAKKRQEVSIEGVKLSDLVPKNTNKMPAAINLKIFTFQIPAYNYSILSNAFNSLSKNKMRFSSNISFQKNGFITGHGNADSWKLIGDGLQKTHAKRANVKSLIVYDELGDDFTTGKLSLETSTSYFGLDGIKKEMTLPPGFIGWRIKTHILAERRGTAQIKMTGLFKQFLDNMFSRLPGYDNGDIIFKPTSVTINMNEGDFFLLGLDPEKLPNESDNERGNVTPSKDRTQIEHIPLHDLFFKTTTDIIMPEAIINPQDEQDKKNPGPTGYRRVKNVDVIEIYLIVCMGVEN